MERITVGGKIGFQLYPATPQNVFLWYYRRPAPVALVMTPDPVTKGLKYDPTASSGFEWQEEAMGDITGKIVRDFATYIREAGLYQLSQAEPKT